MDDPLQVEYDNINDRKNDAFSDYLNAKISYLVEEEETKQTSVTQLQATKMLKTITNKFLFVDDELMNEETQDLSTILMTAKPSNDTESTENDLKPPTNKNPTKKEPSSLSFTVLHPIRSEVCIGTKNGEVSVISFTSETKKILHRFHINVFELGEIKKIIYLDCDVLIHECYMADYLCATSQTNLILVLTERSIVTYDLMEKQITSTFSPPFINAKTFFFSGR